MDNVFLMHVMDATDELSKKSTSITFLKIAMCKNVFKQFAALMSSSSSNGEDHSPIYKKHPSIHVANQPEAHCNIIPMYFSVSITSYSLTI